MAPVEIAGNPQFLARHAHGDKQDVRAQFGKVADDFRLLRRREKPVLHDDDAVLRRHLLQPLAGAFGILARGAQQADGQRFVDCPQKSGHQVGAVEIGRKRRAIKQLGSDIDADAVRKDHEIVQRMGEDRIDAGGVGIVGVEEGDLGETLLAHQPGQKRQRLFPTETRDRNAQDRFCFTHAAIPAGRHLRCRPLYRGLRHGSRRHSIPPPSQWFAQAS